MKISTASCIIASVVFGIGVAIAMPQLARGQQCTITLPGITPEQRDRLCAESGNSSSLLRQYALDDAAKQKFHQHYQHFANRIEVANMGRRSPDRMLERGIRACLTMQTGTTFLSLNRQYRQQLQADYESWLARREKRLGENPSDYQRKMFDRAARKRREEDELDIAVRETLVRAAHFSRLCEAIQKN